MTFILASSIIVFCMFFRPRFTYAVFAVYTFERFVTDGVWYMLPLCLLMLDGFADEMWRKLPKEKV